MGKKKIKFNILNTNINKKDYILIIYEKKKLKFIVVQFNSQKLD